MEWKCPICDKKFEVGIKNFAIMPRTTLFGRFKIKDPNGNAKMTDRKLNYPVCSEECKRKNEEQYFVEEQKGNNIYCVNGRYMPYLECDYWYDNIEETRKRIDNPYLLPVTPRLIHGLRAAMSGELGDI